MHLFSRFSRTKAFERGLIAGGMDVSYISPLFTRAPAVFPLPQGGGGCLINGSSGNQPATNLSLPYCTGPSGPRQGVIAMEHSQLIVRYS